MKVWNVSLFLLFAVFPSKAFSAGWLSRLCKNRLATPVTEKKGEEKDVLAQFQGLVPQGGVDRLRQILESSLWLLGPQEFAKLVSVLKSEAKVEVKVGLLPRKLLQGTLSELFGDDWEVFKRRGLEIVPSADYDFNRPYYPAQVEPFLVRGDKNELFQALIESAGAWCLLPRHFYSTMIEQDSDLMRVLNTQGWGMTSISKSLSLQIFFMTSNGNTDGIQETITRRLLELGIRLPFNIDVF
jgi:hypothetical protein